MISRLSCIVCHRTRYGPLKGSLAEMYLWSAPMPAHAVSAMFLGFQALPSMCCGLLAWFPLEVRVGHGGDKEWFLERGTNPKRARRTCTC
jgi:hypothetical protein